MQQLDKNDYIYTPLFCEENIWKLINSLYMNQYAKPIDVLFILNQTRTIALFGQNNSDLHSPLIWDYHVILTANKDKKIVIFDFDSQCNFPATLTDYFNTTFPDYIHLSDIYQPLIKTINPRYYLKHFYSNRQHMTGVIDNTEFPCYDIIKPKKNNKKLTLETCRDLQACIPGSKIQLPGDYLNKIYTSKIQTSE